MEGNNFEFQSEFNMTTWHYVTVGLNRQVTVTSYRVVDESLKVRVIIVGSVMEYILEDTFRYTDLTLADPSESLVAGFLTRVSWKQTWKRCKVQY